MSLTTLEELHAKAVEHPERNELVYERVKQRIHDASHPMPPLNQPQLTDSELSTIDVWLDAGSVGGEACSGTSSEGAGGADGMEKPAEPKRGGAGEGGSGGSSGSGGAAKGSQATEEKPAMPQTSNAGGAGAMQAASATAGSGGSAPEECEEYVEVRARQNLDGEPYRVAANATDVYACFLYDMGFDKPTQALGFQAIVGNAAVLHHWILRIADRIDAKGPIINCDDTYPTNRMVHGWGPGASDYHFPPDVGMELGRGLFYIEMHYNNFSGAPAKDDSGVRICVTHKPRPKSASVSWLGTQIFTIPPNAKSYVVDSRCKPSTQTENIYGLRVWPHMHARGRRALMRIDHVDGSSTPLLDMPFSVDTQAAYDIPFTVRPGDSIYTACTFDNPSPSVATVGTKTTDEMCHFFVTAYPSFTLQNGALSTEPANTVCLGNP